MSRAFIAGSLALAVLVAFAFWPGYFSKSPGTIDAYTHFHALIAALWLLLLLAQPALVATRRFEWHRTLGRTSWVLAPLFVLSAILLAHFRFSRMDETTFAKEAYSLYLPLSSTLLFGLSFALSMVYRKTPELHSRFIACTALLLVDPVCGRVLAFYVVELPQTWHYQLVTFGIEAMVLAVMAATLSRRSRSRRAFTLFSVFYIGVLAAYFSGTQSAAWHGIADWFRRQPLT